MGWSPGFRDRLPATVLAVTRRPTDVFDQPTILDLGERRFVGFRLDALSGDRQETSEKNGRDDSFWHGGDPPEKARTSTSVILCLHLVHLCTKHEQTLS